MKNLIGSCVGLLCFFVNGCTENFTPTFEKDAGFGGRDSGTTGTVITTSSSKNQTSQTTQVVEKYLLTTCQKDFVFTPWTNYSLINSPVINCIGVPPGKTTLVIHSFEYNLFDGVAPEPEPTCKISQHNAVWFKVSVQNEDYVLPNNVVLEEMPANLLGQPYENWKNDTYDGKIVSFKVDLNESMAISGPNELFCFGHRIAEDASFYPTCDVGCQTNTDDYKQHQLSDSSIEPYNFNTLNSWPSDGDPSKTVSLISAIYATEE